MILSEDIVTVKGKIIIYSSILIYLFNMYFIPDYFSLYRGGYKLTGQMTAGQ